MKYLIFILLAGCAAPSLVLKHNDLLPYKESSQITKVAIQTQPLKIVSVIDKRTDDHYGYAYTGVQYKKTPLYLDKNLSDLIREQVTDAFEIRDIKVNDSANALALQIEVKQVWVEEVIEKYQPEKARCQVRLALHIEKDSQKWSGEYWNEFESSGDLSDGTERLAPTLASCLNDVIEKIVSDTKFVNFIEVK